MATLDRTTGTNRKRPNLERQAITFTIALYLFICAGLLAVHYLQPEMKEVGSSSSSPAHQGETK